MISSKTAVCGAVDMKNPNSADRRKMAHTIRIRNFFDLRVGEVGSEANSGSLSGCMLVTIVSFLDVTRRLKEYPYTSGMLEVLNLKS
jgi:hypothetical protein